MPMTVKETSIKDVILIQPKVFGDDRGCFFESFNQREFDAASGYHVNFVQDNHSRSVKNVLRGLHYQIKQPQGKLVRVVNGAVLDVAVDLRRHSPTFGCHVKTVLTAENNHQLWIPPGFAHGFLVLSEYADFLYKTTDYWYPEHERCVSWNDLDLAIAWPDALSPILADKDANGKRFRDAELFD